MHCVNSTDNDRGSDKDRNSRLSGIRRVDEEGTGSCCEYIYLSTTRVRHVEGHHHG